MANISYIIPSAGYSKRLYPISADTPKLLIKLNGVPIFSLLYRQAIENNCKNVIVAIGKDFERQFKEFIECNYKNAPLPVIIKVVDDSTKGVLYSVFTAMACEECADEALIVLSDTYYTGKLPEGEADYIVYSEVEPPLNRWCLIKENNGVITSFHDKPKEDVETNKALIGVYKIHTGLFIESALSVINDEQNKINNEFQLSSAFRWYLFKRGILAIKAEKNSWYDTGTLINLQKTSKDFFVSRSFNHIKIEDGYLLKSSTKKEALTKQYLWYHNCKAKDLIPAVYELKESIDKTTIKMELCAMPDLGTYFNYCIAEPTFFEQAISSLLQKMQDKVWTDFQYDGSSIVNNSSMWLQKTDDRLTEYKFASIENKKKILSLEKDLLKVYTYLYDLIFQYSLTTKVHGDFILSNVLFDPQKMTFKLIDPRGSYGNSGMYGDIRYDLAKMLHSLNGKYESIINNLFEIKDNEVIFYMNEQKQKCFDAAKKTLLDFAKQEYNIEEKELLAIEIMLYFSMLPLHKENKTQQEAFYLTGKKLLKEWINKYEPK